MSMPEIVGSDVTQEQALTDLLVSIAMEEAALAHLINAEAEKVQAVAARMFPKHHHHSKIDLNEIAAFQKKVAGVIQAAIKMQMLLQFKLENVLDAKLQLEIKDKKDKWCKKPHAEEAQTGEEEG